MSKYAKMAGHSPFAPPTAPVAVSATPPPAPAPGWADGLTVTMIAQDGANYMVTVEDAQNPLQHLYLTTEQDHETRMAVVSVKWGISRDDPPTITLSKGTEFAQVRYEPAAGNGVSTPAGGNGLPGPGGIRNPPIIPGSQPFHAPFQASVAQPGNAGANNVLRRPLIRAQPPTAPTAVRPGANLPNAAVRRNPAVQVDDDDDD